jgi:hypothetical protein
MVSDRVQVVRAIVTREMLQTILFRPGLEPSTGPMVRRHYALDDDSSGEPFQVNLHFVANFPERVVYHEQVKPLLIGCGTCSVRPIEKL